MDQEQEVATTNIGRNEIRWSILCHGAGIFGTPLGGIVFIAIIWALGMKKECSFLNQNAKEALNFQVSLLVYIIVGVILAAMTGYSFSVHLQGTWLPSSNLSLFLVEVSGYFVLPFFLGIFEIVMVIKAVIITAKQGEFRYPLTLRFIK